MRKKTSFNNVVLPFAGLIIVVFSAVAVSILTKLGNVSSEGTTPDLVTANEINLKSALHTEPGSARVEEKLDLLIGEIEKMKLDIERIKNLEPYDSAGLVQGARQQERSVYNLSELYQEFANSPEKLNALAEYSESLTFQREVMANEFFEAQEVDDVWSQEAASYLELSVTSDLAAVGAQVSHSDCRVGVCKVAFNIPKSATDSPDGEMALQHDVLISISKKFPRSRLSTSSTGSDIRIEGYVTDDQTSIPEPDHILSDGRITEDELALVLANVGR